MRKKGECVTERQYLHLNIVPESDGRTVGQVLRRGMGLPGGYISHLKFVPEGILCNDMPVHVDRPVHAGDRLSVRIDDVGQSNPFPPVDCGCELVWQDEYLYILCKPFGIATHGVYVSGYPTVANHAAYLFGREAPFHPINRLDRDTGGLMLAAKCALMHERMRRALHTERFARQYLAICDGACPPGGEIRRPVGQKEALTFYERLWTDGDVSLVQLRLATGRTHQIRSHMADIGHPLTGDRLYGGSHRMVRAALHSAAMAFDHPVSGQRMRFSRPLPADMADFLALRGCPVAFFRISVQ